MIEIRLEDEETGTDFLLSKWRSDRPIEAIGQCFAEHFQQKGRKFGECLVVIAFETLLILDEKRCFDGQKHMSGVLYYIVLLIVIF